MSNILMVLVVIFLLAGSAACTSDPYDDLPKNCIYNVSKVSAGFGRIIQEEAKIPVVCGQPTNLHDLLGKSRKHVESMLGPGINAKKLGIVDSMFRHMVAYRGGGIVVFYHNGDNDGVSYGLRITVEKSHPDKSEEDIIRALFPPDTVLEFHSMGMCEAGQDICIDELEYTFNVDRATYGSESDEFLIFPFSSHGYQRCLKNKVQTTN